MDVKIIGFFFRNGYFLTPSFMLSTPNSTFKFTGTIGVDFRRQDTVLSSP